MNVVRLNMSHGTHDSHKAIVDLVKEYNATGRGCLATMLDTKGPEVRSGDLAEPLELNKGDKLTFTIREGATGEGRGVRGGGGRVGERRRGEGVGGAGVGGAGRREEGMWGRGGMEG